MRAAPARRSVSVKDETTEMPRAITEIKSLARSHTRTALNVLVGVMRNTRRRRRRGWPNTLYWRKSIA